MSFEACDTCDADVTNGHEPSWCPQYLTDIAELLAEEGVVSVTEFMRRAHVALTLSAKKIRELQAEIATLKNAGAGI